MGATLPVWEGIIEVLAQDGTGVGTRTVKEGGKEFKRPIFIPYTTPGDKIRARIVRSKGKYYFGELDAIISPSPDRQEIRCPHYTSCGGCNLQHVAYETQLKEKARQVSYLLEKQGFDIPETVRIWPSRKLHKYRWRSRIAVLFTGDRAIAGFRKRNSRQIIPIQTCYIVSGEIREFIHLLNTTPAEIEGVEIEIVAVMGEKRKVGILVPLGDVPDGKRDAVREYFTQLYALNRKLLANLFFEEDGAVKTAGQVQEHITYHADDVEFMFLPETFIQNNVLTNDLLVGKCMDALFPEGKSETRVLDLYAGIGNFSLPAAKRCKEVVAVEVHDAAVTAGETNALRNKIENVKFVRSSAEAYLARITAIPETIILDPPRIGCSGKVLDRVACLSPERILYISCNPQTLARDLKELPGYKIHRLFGVDMFPDISHVEIVALLGRE